MFIEATLKDTRTGEEISRWSNREPGVTGPRGKGFFGYAWLAAKSWLPGSTFNDRWHLRIRRG